MKQRKGTPSKSAGFKQKGDTPQWGQGQCQAAMMKLKRVPATLEAGKRLAAFLILFCFSFHQLSFAYVIQPSVISLQTSAAQSDSKWASDLQSTVHEQAASFPPEADPSFGGQGIGGAIINFGANVFGGGLIGGFIQGIGAVVARAGTALVNYGTRLINQSKELFSNFKSGFAKVQEFFKQGSFDKLSSQAKIEIFNPKLPDGIKLKSLSGHETFLHLVEEQVKLPIPQGTQKSVFDSILGIVLDTAQSAAMGAISATLTADPSFGGQAQVQGRAPPVNAPSIQGNSLINPNTQRPWMSIDGTYAFAYDDEGNLSRYQSQNSPYPQKLERINDDTYRNIQENGRIVNVRHDSASGQAPQIEVIDDRIDGVQLPSFEEVKRFVVEDVFDIKSLEQRYSELYNAIQNGTIRYELCPEGFGCGYPGLRNNSPIISQGQNQGLNLIDPFGFNRWVTEKGFGYPDGRITNIVQKLLDVHGRVFTQGNMSRLDKSAQIYDGAGQLIYSESRNTQLANGLVSVISASVKGTLESHNAGVGAYYVYKQYRGPIWNREYRYFVVTGVPEYWPTGRDVRPSGAYAVREYEALRELERELGLDRRDRR